MVHVALSEHVGETKFDASFHQFRMKFAQRLQGPQLISIDSIRQTQGPRVSRQFALRSLRSVTVAGRFPITSMIWPFKQI